MISRQNGMQHFDLLNWGQTVPSITLRANWTGPGAKLVLQIDPTTVFGGKYAVLALRIGQSVDPANVPDRDQDFTVEISSGSRTAAVRASSLHRIVYPDTDSVPPKTIMQSLRIPTRHLSELGVDLDDIRTIALVFDRRPTGTLFIGDVQFSN